MTKMKIASLVVAAVALTSVGDTAWAGHAYWQMVGAGCSPADGPIQNNMYSYTNGRVDFKSGVTGSMEFVCPVMEDYYISDTYGLANTLDLDYLDSDGTGTNAYVEMFFYRVTRHTGTIAQVGSTLSSNSSSTTTANEIFNTFSQTLDYATYNYFVDAVMYRFSTAYNSSLYAVAIDD